MQVFEFLQEYLYIALFLYILIEEIGIFLPIPGDAVLIYLGILSRDGDADFLITLVITCLATWVGTTFLYTISRMVGRPFLENHQAILKLIHISPQNISNMEHYMLHYGTWVIIISRLTPGLRIIGTIAAGLLNVPYKNFFLSTMLGTVLWTGIYFGLGAYLGEHHARQVEMIFSNKLLLLAVFIMGVTLWACLFKLFGPRLHSHARKHKDAKQTNTISS